MSWLLLHYQPTTLFSLRISVATSTVSRSLILPTPYAIKMAFVDAAFRSGWEKERCQSLVKDLVGIPVRIKPSCDSIVTQTIQKIRQESKDKTSGEPYVSSVAYREVVYVPGNWTWAFEVAGKEILARDIISLAPVVHYVGKRGSMIQFLGHDRTDELGPDFTKAMSEIQDHPLPPRSHVVMLDDFGPEADLTHLDSYNPDTKIVQGKHRVFVNTLVPVGIVNAGPGFVHYSDGS